MGTIMQLGLMIMQLILITNSALLVDGSAGYRARSPASSPVHGMGKRHRDHHHGFPTRGGSIRHKPMRPSSISVAPSISNEPGKGRHHFPANAPLIPMKKHHRYRDRVIDSAPRSSVFPPHFHRHPRGPRHSTFHSHRANHISPAPAPAPGIIPNRLNEPALSPAFSPSGLVNEAKTPPPSTVIMFLPPPPPNGDCARMTCTAPMTYNPPGSPCSCVWPIQVELRLEVAVYTFFPLVSEFAKEIASSIMLNHSQVRIMGADSVSQQQLGETTVLINLVPTGLKFGDFIARSIYEKFWHKQIQIQSSHFGNYEVLYVHYPGLPPSPPSSHSGIPTSGSLPYSGGDSNGQAVKPLGVNLPKERKHGNPARITIAVIVVSSFSALMVCIVAVMLLKRKARRPSSEHPDLYYPEKPSGAAGSVVEKGIPASASISFRSNSMAYTGAAKIFSLKDIEIATNNFNPSRIVGEGGFGVVYSGKLDDSQEVAVKVLKREDRHGTREFLAEVEMLSRLHHRNLVKLIGICTHERVRCLVYELIANGSVDSHLHGADKEKSPLDWGSRIKIALGAARGLAYLHEDSNPRVIHRDFKSSNILLEYDFTPKLSDFGLARAAQDEDNRRVSTQVMGTFGYLAPEYAMTGHLLVKSDVYSYGVVLLELLTGRKPVDLSQPQGQENLVSWARPLLTNREGLETIVDQSLKMSGDAMLDSLSKVAAIASMCAQPEASNRPFMGEVVQALKLVCSEFDNGKGVIGCDSITQLPESPDLTGNTGTSGNFGEIFRNIPSSDPPQYSFGSDHETQLGSSDVGRKERVKGEFWDVSSHFGSGPLRLGKRRKFWQRLKSLSRGSMSEHEITLKFWPESY